MPSVAASIATVQDEKRVDAEVREYHSAIRQSSPLQLSSSDKDCLMVHEYKDLKKFRQS